MSKAQATKRRLLDTALEMLHEQGPSAGVSHILLSKVVDRAGVTIGSAYPHWPGQKDFQRELAVEAVRWRDRQSTEKTFAQIREVFEQGGPLNEVLRLGAQGNIHSVSEDMAFLTTMALRMSAFGDPDLVAASHERHIDAMRAFSELYARVLESYGRRMREPFTVSDLSAVLAALMEGFLLQTVTGEEHPRFVLSASSPEVAENPQTGNDWTLLGVAVVTMVERMTEPGM